MDANANDWREAVRFMERVQKEPAGQRHLCELIYA